MHKKQPYAAKVQMMTLIQAGHFWREAAATAGVQISRSSAYHLMQKVQAQGEVALCDGRHGHRAKLRGPIREWLETTCREAPQTPSRVVQAALQEQFGIQVSIGHLNRVRAALGVGSRNAPREKNFSHPILQPQQFSGKRELADFFLSQPLKKRVCCQKWFVRKEMRSSQMPLRGGQLSSGTCQDRNCSISLLPSMSMDIASQATRIAPTALRRGVALPPDRHTHGQTRGSSSHNAGPHAAKVAWNVSCQSRGAIMKEPFASLDPNSIDEQIAQLLQTLPASQEDTESSCLRDLQYLYRKAELLAHAQQRLLIVNSPEQTQDREPQRVFPSNAWTEPSTMLSQTQVPTARKPFTRLKIVAVLAAADWRADRHHSLTRCAHPVYARGSPQR